MQNKRRESPGSVALHEITRYQESTNLLLLKALFQRFVRGIMDGITQKQVRFTSSALQALQVASEN
jgi:histone H3/H4